MGKHDALEFVHTSYMYIMNKRFYVSLKENMKRHAFLLVAFFFSHYCLAQKGNNAGLDNYEKPQGLKKYWNLKCPLQSMMKNRAHEALQWYGIRFKKVLCRNGWKRCLPICSI
jgi:hypothetical protein